MGCAQGCQGCCNRGDFEGVRQYLPNNVEINPDFFRQDELTVMNCNTYLMEIMVAVQVSKKPNLVERADGWVKYLASMTWEELPDVLVLNEVYSEAAETMMQRLACKAWNKEDGETKVWSCDRETQFETTTGVVNAKGALNPMKGGGVVVLTKKGSRITEAYDFAFEAKKGSDALSAKGFWLVKVEKGKQTYWVVGTHTQAWGMHYDTREQQFKQIRSEVERRVPEQSRVCYAGDMNIFTQAPPTDPEQWYAGPETDKMMGALRAQPAGDLQKRGFWLKLDSDMATTVVINQNHFCRADKYEVEQVGDQEFDWILVPADDDKYVTPNKMRRQIIPVKHDKFLQSECSNCEGQRTDDLSDHCAVFAQLWYGQGQMPAIKELQGHRGVKNKLPRDLESDELPTALGG